MRRTVSALFTVALAMLLSVAMVAPAAHADAWSDYIKDPNNPKYKYSFDYYKRALRPVDGIQSVGPKLPVSGTVNPSNTGGSYYLNQIKQSRLPNPSNVPLEGKIITPGQTVVRAPSTYGPVTKFAVPGATLGLSRLIGTAGVGIGGTSVAPANANQLALNQGVSQGCIDNGATCTSAEQAKRFMIGSCAQFTGANSCDSIGATGANGETKSADWFKDDVIPFLNDLWAKLTGQGSDKNPTDTHQEVVMTRGCYRSFGIEYRGENNITLHGSAEIVAGRPTDSTQAGYWDNECGAAKLANYTPVHGTMQTTCVKPDGSSVNATGTQSLGLTGSIGFFSDDVTGANKIGLCNTGQASGQPLTLVRIRIWQDQPQSYYTSPGASKYSAIRYSEWTNPDPELNTIEDTKITTTWTCTTKDGTAYNFTKSVTKISAAVAPACPAGSDLTQHAVTATGGSAGTTTLDQGANIPAESAKYPLCVGGGSPGCTMDIYVDGTKCTVARIECRTWPAVSAQTPSRVVCKWGTYVLPTSNCTAIANGYQSETGVVFDPHAGTWIGIDDYGNPIAPNPEPWNPTNPNPAPGVTPGTTTPTTPGTGTTNPTFPTTGTSPSNNCDAPGWSWNPVEWVHNPVVCALKDAFVPKTDIQAKITALRDTVKDAAPVSWISKPLIGPSGGGCPDWRIVIPGQLNKNVVCDSSFTAAILGARGPMFGIVASAMIWPLLRGIWYALIPIVRVTPTGSK